jgi:hypothetical protein
MSENIAQICPKCGAASKEGDVFCRVCGTRHLAGINEIKPPSEARRICQNCGNMLRPAARFCDLCGEECVKLWRERRGWRRKVSWCFLILAAALLWLAAGVSSIAIYNASKDASFRGVLTFMRETLFAPASEISRAGDEAAEMEPDGGGWVDISEDSYETVISNDILPAVTPITVDDSVISPQQDDEARQTGQNSPENTDDGPPLSDGKEGADAAAGNTSSDTETGAMVLASPLSVSPESDDAAVSADGRQDSGAWTAQDSEGYSIVAANDRFFTSSQIPSLRGIVTGDNVRVRSAPNTASRIKKHFDKGAEVELVRRFSSGKEQYYWFEARDSGESGWVYGEFIKPEAGDNKVLPPADTGDGSGHSAAETTINTSP